MEYAATGQHLREGRQSLTALRVARFRQTSIGVLGGNLKLPPVKDRHHNRAPEPSAKRAAYPPPAVSHIDGANQSQASSAERPWRTSLAGWKSRFYGLKAQRRPPLSPANARGPCSYEAANLGDPVDEPVTSACEPFTVSRPPTSVSTTFSMQPRTQPGGPSRPQALPP